MRQAIRFWHYANGAVLIKIKAGQTLYHSIGAETDEGWSRESYQWEFDGEMLVCRWTTDGRDCDGRLTRYGKSYCWACHVRSGLHDHDLGVTWPAWEHGKSGQRDYTAESMNY
jgi:hypothetical protein